MLDKHEYTDSATRCVIVIEMTLRYVLDRSLERLDEAVRDKIQNAIQKRDRRREGIEGLTLGQLIHVFRESALFDAWAQASGNDLSSLNVNL